MTWIIKSMPRKNNSSVNPIFNKTVRGFTLIEIIAFFAIIGIVATISVPVYRQAAPSLKLNTTSRMIASDLRYAQQRAVTEQVNYTISFNTNQNNFTITNTETYQIIRTTALDPAITIQSIVGLTSNTVNFNVTGAATESGSITLVNANNKTAVIEIKPSGYVKIGQ